MSRQSPFPSVKRQCQLKLIQIEAIYFTGSCTKIPNHNAQNTNKIKITNSNDQNITIAYWMPIVIISVLNFGHWYLFEPALARLDGHKPSSVANFRLVSINTIGVNPVWARDLFFGAWNFHDLH
jgi:hypothetical protein